MPFATDLMRRLGLDHPIIQAPMAGGGDTPALVAAAGEARALGFIGGAYLTPPQIEEASRAVRARSNRPFGINLFAPQPAPEIPEDMQPALDAVAPYFAELGLSPPAPPQWNGGTFEAQLAAALQSGATVFSFALGVPPADAVAAVKARGMLLIGTATSVEEALILQAAGADAVVAQGSEAGGHRASFAGFEAGMIGTMALVPQMVDAIAVPVIASGGIMDGRGIAAALALGAEAVQLGTAFLTCAEAGVPEAYKAAILNAREHQVRLTRAFSGRPARGIVNRFMAGVEGAPVLPFPLQNTLTRPMRTAAAAQGRAEYLSLWAGQGVRLARRERAADLIARLAREAEQTIARLSVGG